MRKWILLLCVVGMVAGMWYYVRTYKRVTPMWNQPKFGKVTRGDIRVPITAAGLIQPLQEIEVKPKASGEVVEIHFAEGDFVRKGDVLVLLKRDDEQRSVDRARSELKRAESLLEQARIAVDQARVAVQGAEGRLENLEAQVRMAEFDVNKIEELKKNQAVYSVEEEFDARQQLAMLRAQQKTAQADLEAARIRVRDAEEAVRLQEAAVEIATKTLADAEERLAETSIVSKHDAIVTSVKVTVGSVVQGGQTTFTGGTVLMTLADVSTKKVVTRVDESDYGRILDISPTDALPQMPGLAEALQQSAEQLARRSGKVKLTVDAFPDDEFEGQIIRVEPQGRLNQGSSIIQFNVHVAITDPQAYLLPLGAQAQVEFTVESVTNELRVPAEAVKTYQEQRGVWVKVPPEPGSGEQWGRKFIPCRFGITDGAHTQLIAPLSGGQELKEGDEVYTKLPVSNEG